MPLLAPVLGAFLGQGTTNLQNNITKQQLATEADQQKLMDTYAQLQQTYGKDAANFYLQYMAQGNPWLSNLLSQHFGQIAQQYGNQQGLLGQKLAASGFGAAPSGLAAASAGDLSRAEANTQSESWLNDMMQNEQLKFQAAQGLGGIANMFQPGQFALHRFSNPTVAQSPWTQVPGAIGQGLSSLIPGLSQPQQSAATPSATPSSGASIPGLPQLPGFLSAPIG